MVKAEMDTITAELILGSALNLQLSNGARHEINN